jgi:hypothetical protein
MQVQVDGLPANELFDVELVSITEVPRPEKDEHPDYDDKSDWTVMVVGGDYDGTLVTDRVPLRDTETGKLRLTKKAQLGRLVRDLLGRDPRPAETLDFDKFVGRRYKLLTGEKDGKTKFEKLTPIPSES